ncbi:uncharacterized protein [Henckelia pumila]|uniref:uncharacterized protein isoform X1 n=2 Tax=Henckelia pumila TaxID=405737 RepID=UPI003C6DDB71
MERVIPCVNFYDHNPQELIGMAEIKESEEYYFFTEMEGNGKRSSRKTKGGFWKATAKDKPVYDRAGSLIGYKRSLDFYQDKNKRTEFKMNEYTTTSVKISSSNNKIMKYWVINKIYRNKQTVGMKRSIKDDADCEWPISVKRAKKDDEVNDHIHLEDGQSFEEFKYLEDITDDKIFEDDRVNHSNGQATNFNMDDITVAANTSIGHHDQNYMFDGYTPNNNNVFAILPDDHWQVDPFHDMNQSQYGFYFGRPESSFVVPQQYSLLSSSGSSC